MRIGDVQDPDRVGPLGEDAQRVVAHGEEVALDAHAPHGGPDSGRPRDPEGCEGGRHERTRHQHFFATMDRAIAVLLFVAVSAAGFVAVTRPSFGALPSAWQAPIDTLVNPAAFNAA